MDRAPQCTINDDFIRLQRKHIDLTRVEDIRAGAEFIDPYGQFCSSESKCNMVHDGTILYRDNNHLNLRGSLEISRFILKSLLQIMSFELL